MFPFCPFCGGALTDESGTALEERKVVSVLFCDLVGFTAASEQADPEDVRARIRPYHARLRREVERYGGTLEKFVGDAAMAVFGAPAAHEDDAERAVRAGLRIIESIAELNELDPALELQVRIGINTGQAVVALRARPEQGEGIVTGDVVNTAARIETAAPPGAVAVSEQTYRQTQRVFDYEPLEAVRVKGKSEPLRLYLALAARARFGADVTRTYATPLVGRELEKELLIGTFERAAQQRTCQLVTIVGEPGVGKSRLCSELFQYLEDRPGLVRWRQGRCLPYGEGIAFWALGEIVKAECGILESDEPADAAAKLDRALPADAPDRGWLKARLSPLVGVGGEAVAQEESFTAWRRVLESWAAERETVLVFEDLHWADAALLSFLEHLADWAEGLPLVVLCTARPELYEQHQTWAAGLRNATTINLGRLSDDETARLIASLLQRAVLPAATQQSLLERAGGNPLYAEEFARLLADRDLFSGALDDVPLPDSVQALIAARLDTLAPDRKSLLQDAAVVGKVFWAGALAAMGDRDPREVEVALHELARKELVRPVRGSSMESESEFAFWHVLVRDVTYGQIPRTERIRRHYKAAVWIEQKAGGRIEDLAEVVAHHYVLALELARSTSATEEASSLIAPARRYLTLAGERALGLDTAQAEARFRQALDLSSEDEADWPELMTRWAEAAQEAGRPRDAAEAAERALGVFRARGDDAGRAKALIVLSRAVARLGEARQLDLAADAVAVLERLDPSPALIGAYLRLGAARSNAGDDPDGVAAAAEQALLLAETLGEPVPAYALGQRGLVRAMRGDRDGLAEIERAIALLIAQGAGLETAMMMNQLAVARYPLDGNAASLAAYKEGIEFCEQRGIVEPRAVLEINSVEALGATGRTEEALALADRLIAAARERDDVYVLSGLMSFVLGIRAGLGESDAMQTEADWVVSIARSAHWLDTTIFGLAAAAFTKFAHEPAQAVVLLAEVEQTPGARQNTNYPSQLTGMVRIALAAGDHSLAERLVSGVEPIFPLFEHALIAVRAQLAEHAGDHAEAAALYGNAAERWQSFANAPEHGYALLGRGRCLLALGDTGAEQPLREAREIFRSMGYRPALADAEALLEQAAAPAA
jgi:class 3 adenylate cyclase/tetratricopeptide (TPR) repeat protein